MTNNEFDATLRAEGYSSFCGVDEAGRGPLAGPVYAAAVILSPEQPIPGINDSKKLSEKRREQLFDVICERALAYSIAYATVEEIEQLNILQATLLAMRRAVEGLSVTPQLAAIDGNKVPPGLQMQAISVVKGDALSASIGAASVLAKVSRDRVMREMDALYPGYGFAVHKGYGTAAHIAALREYGPSSIHRPSFLGKILGGPR